MSENSIAFRAGQFVGRRLWVLTGVAVSILAITLFLTLGDGDKAPNDTTTSVPLGNATNTEVPAAQLADSGAQPVSDGRQRTDAVDRNSLLTLESRCESELREVLLSYAESSSTPQKIMGAAFQEVSRWGEGSSSPDQPTNIAQSASRASTFYYGLCYLLFLEATANVSESSEEKNLALRAADSIFAESNLRSLNDAGKFWSLVATWYTFVALCKNDSYFNHDIESQARSNGPQPLGSQIAKEFRRLRYNLASRVQERYESISSYGLERFGPPSRNYLAQGLRQGSGDSTVEQRTLAYWNGIRTALSDYLNGKMPRDPQERIAAMVARMGLAAIDIKKLDTSGVDRELVQTALEFASSAGQMTTPRRPGRDVLAELSAESMLLSLKQLQTMQSRLAKKYGEGFAPLLGN